MKLYYSPGACSLSPHIVLREAGLPFALEKVDLKTKRMAGEADFNRINPKGYVPALQFDDGSVLTEGAAIVQWVADEVPAKHLVPPAGTMERYRVIEWLGFISTELHKNFSPLFNPATPDAVRDTQLATLAKRIGYVEQHITGPYLTGTHFTVADAYLFTVLSWAKYVKLDLAPYAGVNALLARIAARPAVQEALKAEGLA
ncbi:MAG: glutathione transferase GstA [Betaproteobacteria bacterium]